MDILAQWLPEIILSLLCAGALAFCRHFYKRYKDYKNVLEEKEDKETEIMIDHKLEPIYEELEALRTYIRETEVIEKTHMSLIIASYKFRLIQLCRELLKQEYMTQKQYDQLTEFYKLYSGLGGNGQAKEYYDKTILLPIHDEP